MNKSALYIPRPGFTYGVIMNGYVDALRHLGWTVYVGDPATKLGCSNWIKKHNIKLVMTSSRYGVRQLPIETINDNDVAVVVDILPLNTKELTIDGSYESAHNDEPCVTNKIKSLVLYTRIEKHLWPVYLCRWLEESADVIAHVPMAGNLLKASPSTFTTLTDVAMVANFRHRQDVMRNVVCPLFQRLSLLGYSYQAFGDDIWKLAGLNYNGSLKANTNQLAHIYATANICPNVHTEKQVGLQAYLNERSFMIPLCGGVQVLDNPLASKYLGPHCEIATSTTDFINKTIMLAEDPSKYRSDIMDRIEHVANNHTYFQRLTQLFDALGLSDFASETAIRGQREAVTHCWKIRAILSAEERGVPYEQKAI